MQGEDCIVRRKGVIGPRAGAGEGAGAGAGAGKGIKIGYRSGVGRGAGTGAEAGDVFGAGALEVVGSNAWVWDMGSSRSGRARRSGVAMQASTALVTTVSHCQGEETN